MAESNRQTWVSRWHAAKRVLDVAASLAVIVGVAILVTQLSAREQPATPRSVKPGLPKQPLSLEGASLIGNLRAPVAVLEFSDFECSFCGAFARDVLPILQTQLIQPGRVLFAFRNFPIKRHPNAEPAALAATCAGDQGQFEPLHDMFFNHPKQLDRASLEKYTDSLPVDRSVFLACLKSAGPARVAADRKEAEALGVTGTPTFFIGTVGPDRKLTVTTAFKGTRPATEFIAAVDSATAGK